MIAEREKERECRHCGSSRLVEFAVTDNRVSYQCGRCGLFTLVWKVAQKTPPPVQRPVPVLRFEMDYHLLTLHDQIGQGEDTSETLERLGKIRSELIEHNAL